MRHIGFTGTQRGMNERQKKILEDQLRYYFGYGYRVFHHGDCIGADDDAHKIAYKLGYKIIIHPPENQSKRAFCVAHEYRQPKPYLVRNHDIVDESEFLIATPGEMEERLRSGTWATVRYARKINRPIVKILPEQV